MNSMMDIQKGTLCPIAKSIIPKVLQFDDPCFLKLPLRILGKPHLVSIVRGDRVKLLYSMEFEDGSNYIRYPEVCPPCQMWVDFNLAVPQRKFKAFHEIMEVIYDLTVPGISVDDGHKLALNDEFLFRKWDDMGRPNSIIQPLS